MTWNFSRSRNRANIYVLSKNEITQRNEILYLIFMRNFRKNTRHILGGESLFYCNNLIPNFVIYTKANIFFLLNLVFYYYLWFTTFIMALAWSAALWGVQNFFMLYIRYFLLILYLHTHIRFYIVDNWKVHILYARTCFDPYAYIFMVYR